MPTEYVTCPECGTEMTRGYYESHHKLQCPKKPGMSLVVTGSAREPDSEMFYISSADAVEIWRKLQALIKDEEDGIAEYEDILSKTSKHPKLSMMTNMLQEIKADERKHLKRLKRFREAFSTL